MALSSSAFPGVGSVSALAYDFRNHRLLVADATNRLIAAFNGAGDAVPDFAPIPMSSSIAIAYDDSDKKIYVNGDANGVFGISAYNSSGAPRTLALQAFKQTTSPGPLAFVVSSGDIVVGQRNGGSIGEYSDSGHYEISSSLNMSGISGLASNYFSLGSSRRQRCLCDWDSANHRRRRPLRCYARKSAARTRRHSRPSSSGSGSSIRAIFMSRAARRVRSVPGAMVRGYDNIGSPRRPVTQIRLLWPLRISNVWRDGGSCVAY